jgi:hypothetical protein
MKRLLARMDVKMDSNQKKVKADRDERKAIWNAFQEKMDSSQEKADASMAKLDEKMEETKEH